MTTDPNAPDAALLWARERWPHDGAGFHNSAAEAFRAGQAHERRADAGLLAALEAIEGGDYPNAIRDAEREDWLAVVVAFQGIARTAINAAKGHDNGIR